MGYCILYIIKDNVGNDNYDFRTKREQYYKKLFLGKASSLLNIPESELCINKGVHGKPFFPYHKDVHFNISHTIGAWAFALSSKEVGIDIEMLRDSKEGIIKSFYSPEEQEYVNRRREHRNQRFYEVWTWKEAYAKYTGLGLTNSIRKKNMLDLRYQNNIRTYMVDEFIVTLYVIADSIDIRIERGDICG